MSRMLSILFFLVGLAVATRELPELSRLADDTSNDGEVIHWQGQTTLRATHRVETKERCQPAHTFTFAPIENLSCTSVVPARTGQDILRLVVLLRT
jgi:hypothetical protein